MSFSAIVEDNGSFAKSSCSSGPSAGSEEPPYAWQSC
jgi:hypothetical protein